MRNKRRPHEYRVYKTNWEEKIGDFSWRPKGYTLHPDKVTALSYISKKNQSNVRVETAPYMIEAPKGTWENAHRMGTIEVWVD